MTAFFDDRVGSDGRDESSPVELTRLLCRASVSLVAAMAAAIERLDRVALLQLSRQSQGVLTEIRNQYIEELSVPFVGEGEAVTRRKLLDAVLLADHLAECLSRFAFHGAMAVMAMGEECFNLSALCRCVLYKLETDPVRISLSGGRYEGPTEKDLPDMIGSASKVMCDSCDVEVIQAGAALLAGYEDMEDLLGLSLDICSLRNRVEFG